MLLLNIIFIYFKHYERVVTLKNRKRTRIYVEYYKIWNWIQLDFNVVQRISINSLYRVFKRRATHSLTALARSGLIVNLRSILDFQYRLIAKCDLPFFVYCGARWAWSWAAMCTSCLCFNASGGHETQLHTTYVHRYEHLCECVCVYACLVCM